MNLAAVICVRMSSERLPGKALAVYDEASGKTNLECIIDRVRTSRHNPKIVIATTHQPEDRVFFDLAKKWKVDCLFGDLKNVVSRFDDAIHSCYSNADMIWRVMADNPLIDIGLVDHRLDILERNKADLLYPVLPEPTYAAQCNVWSREAWDYCAKHSSGSLLEHPGEFLYQNLSQFRAVSDPGPENIYYQPIRTELDTVEDLQFFKTLFKEYRDAGEWISDGFRIYEDVIPTRGALSFLKSRPDIVALNAHIGEKTHTTYLHGHHRARKLHCENEACRYEIATKVNDRLDIRCPKCGQSRSFYP